MKDDNNQKKFINDNIEYCCVLHEQCCQHLLTRNPKICEENPVKCIGLMGIGGQKILLCFIYIC